MRDDAKRPPACPRNLVSACALDCVSSQLHELRRKVMECSRMILCALLLPPMLINVVCDVEPRSEARVKGIEVAVSGEVGPVFNGICQSAND